MAGVLGRFRGELGNPGGAWREVRHRLPPPRKGPAGAALPEPCPQSPAR